MLSAGAPTLESTATLEMDHGTSGLTMTTLFSRSSARALPSPSVQRHSWSVSMMASVWLHATMHEITLVASTPMNGVDLREKPVTSPTAPSSRPVFVKMPA